ncbi:hypothetical protein ACFV5G_19500 [Streptomyces sp. NPDC059766]|uniref:hypothetical protein n=1 Tax=Streptomyces sp. NPDC059766 TaxID=3346940 RepID=UPI0036577301
MPHDTAPRSARTVAVGIPTPEVLALLPLPVEMTDLQQQGRICVYGRKALSTEAAVDLGERRRDGVLVFPRACQPCVSRAAMSVLLDHSSGPDACTECKREPICEFGRALNRVIRMGQR